MCKDIWHHIWWSNQIKYWDNNYGLFIRNQSHLYHNYFTKILENQKRARIYSVAFVSGNLFTDGSSFGGFVRSVSFKTTISNTIIIFYVFGGWLLSLNLTNRQSFFLEELRIWSWGSVCFPVVTVTSIFVMEIYVVRLVLTVRCFFAQYMQRAYISSLCGVFLFF